MKRTTDWTRDGYRIAAELGGDGVTVVLSCHSQALTRSGNQSATRQEWLLAQLGVPTGTPKSEAAKLVAHWLGFYGDDEAREGVRVFHAVFDSVAESVTPEQDEGGAQSGMAN